MTNKLNQKAQKSKLQAVNLEKKTIFLNQKPSVRSFRFDNQT